MLDGPFPCALTSLDANGTPYGVVVWCGRLGDAVGVNAAEGVWLRNLRRDPRVGLVVVDTRQHPAPRLDQRPRQRDLARRATTRTSTRLSEVYEGRPYAYSTPEDVPRFRVEIEVLKVRTLDLAPPD